MIALLGVLFVDMVGRRRAVADRRRYRHRASGSLLGLAHGLLITKLKMQPFVVTLCGLLIYRGVARGYTGDATAGFPFGSTYPGLDFFVAPHLRHPDLRLSCWSWSRSSAWVVLHRSVFGRYLYAVGKNEEAARFSGIRTDLVIIAAYVICAVLTALAAIFFAMYTRSVQPSVTWQFLRTLRHRGGGAGRLLAARRRRLDHRRGARHDPAADPAEPGQPARHSLLAQFRGDGRR